MLLISNASTIHPLGQVFATIDANLNGHGQPGLQSHVHQTELPVDEVEIDEQALASGQAEFEVTCFPVAADLERPARLDAGEHADQPLSDSVALHHSAGEVLFGDRRRSQINQRAAVLGGKRLGVRFNFIRQALGECPKVLVEHAVRGEERLEALSVLQGPQRAPKQQSIEARQHAHDLLPMPIQKRLHDAPPTKKPIMPTPRSITTPLWLRP